MVICFECTQTFDVQPSDFIRYNTYNGSWLTLEEETDDSPVMGNEGYCKPCQDALDANRDVYGGQGTENIEQRTMEDEMWVWAR